ncbi:MAG: HD domain-containing phosphohydrolase [Acidobacteriota bacterium]
MTHRIEIDRPLLQSLLVLTTVIEAHDPYSGGHVWRTSRYARALAQAAGFGEGDVFLAQLGALVHDVGKVGIPDAILLKEGKITEEEHRVIQLHPEIGHDIIANHPLAPLVDRPIAEHHLRADGAGYPSRLQGTRPWIISKIVSVADAFDAMTSFHPRRRDDAVDHALSALEEERGRQFDADLADAFAELVRRGGADHVLDHAADGALAISCPACGPMIAPPAGALEGHDVECPSSEDAFVLGFASDTFELEWTGRSAFSR